MYNLVRNLKFTNEMDTPLKLHDEFWWTVIIYEAWVLQYRVRADVPVFCMVLLYTYWVCQNSNQVLFLNFFHIPEVLTLPSSRTPTVIVISQLE